MTPALSGELRGDHAQDNVVAALQRSPAVSCEATLGYQVPPLSKRHLRPWHNSRLTAMGIMKFRSRINNFSQPIATLSPSNSSALLSIKITLNTKFKARDASTTFLFLHHRSVNDTPTPPPAAPTSGLQRSDGSRLASFFFAWQSGNVVRKFCLKVAPRLGTPRLEEDRVLESPKSVWRIFWIVYNFYYKKNKNFVSIYIWIKQEILLFQNSLIQIVMCFLWYFFDRFLKNIKLCRNLYIWLLTNLESLIKCSYSKKLKLTKVLNLLVNLSCTVRYFSVWLFQTNGVQNKKC